MNIYFEARFTLINDHVILIVIPTNINNLVQTTYPTENSNLQCTGLDPAWSQLTTEATFPVDEGTVLTVSCEEGFLLRGSNTITCTEGTTFSSANTPTCVELSEFSVL